MSRAGRAGLYLAFLASGLTALLYQILWSRYLTLFVGGTSVAQTIVLATFMAGLAFGNAFFGRRADRPGVDRLRLYALLEAGIGLACLLFPAAFDALSRAYLSVASRSAPGAAVNHVLKVALAAGAMFVPCAFMGGTLPVLAKYVVDSLRGLSVKISWLYFVNTAGAVLGCLVGGFYVVERWGLETGMVGAALVNLAIGGAFYVVSRTRPARAVVSETGEGDPLAGEPAYTPRQTQVAFWCIAVAGAVSMLYELCWTRVLTLSMGSSVHSFSTMLVSFISGIAIGSALAARLMRRPRNVLALFALCEAGVALSILLALPAYERLPYAFHRLGSWLAHSSDTYPLYLLGQVLTAALVMAVPTTLIGAALPLASRVCVDRLDVLGRRVGEVFSANTVGTVVGASLTGFLLLPGLGVERTLVLGCAVSALLGVLLLWVWRPQWRPLSARGLRDAVSAGARADGPGLWAAAAAVLALALTAVLVRPGWDPRLMQAGLFRWGSTVEFRSWDSFRRMAAGDRFLYVKDGMDGTVAVQEQDALNRNIRVNGKVDASVADMATQLMVGHLPMLLHPDPRRAMVVGLGCGATAAAVLRHPGVTADVAEISPEMVQAAAYFEPWNDAVLGNPRMALHVLDAREFLLLTRDRYDVIVSEPTNVWVPGVANLFTRDFYRVVRARLRPGGLFAQWLHVYSAEPAMVASVVASLRAEFPYVSAWLVKETDLILIAGDQRPPFDAARFEQRLAQVHQAEGLPSPPRSALAAFLHPVLFLSHQIGTDQGLQVAWPAGSAPVYRDLRPRLEFEAARSQFVAQRYRVRTRIDERLTRVGAEPLFVEEYLARRPLDANARLVLGDLFTGLGGSYEELGAALTATAVLDGADSPELLARLPESLLAKVVLARVRGRQIDADAQPGAAVCEGYLQAERGLLRAASSVFGRPPAEPLETRVEKCIAATPQAAEGLRTGLARALADAGAAEPALRRIRQIERDGLLDRMQPREAAELLVSGSMLLLQSSQREQAFPWAARALDLDPLNAAAARIVWALKGARAAEPRLTAGSIAPPG